MYKRKKIALVMACLNEAEKIGNSIKKIKKNCKGIVDEIIVVDDGSTDLTFKEAKKAGATVIKHKKNLGAGAAYRTGYFYSLKKGYDITVELAGDDQDDPKDVKKIVESIVDYGFDYVHGSRWIKGGRTVNHPLTRSFLTKLYSFIFRIFTGFPATDATNGIRGFKTEILKNPKIKLNQEWLNKYELEPYFFYKVIQLGYKIKEVPVTKFYHKKMRSNTKMIPFKSWWSILRPLIYLKFKIKE